MLITSEHKSIVKKYFANYSKRTVIMKSKEDASYDEKMFEIVEKVIKLYKPDKEKSIFIEKYLIGQKSWESACFTLHIERRTFYTWKDEILSDAIVLAIQNNLISTGID